ncbi:hypothetical protein V502_10998 [Pseudogymnoascus sp. VKM F-4520 (FW-2644)]|nr:hypothetical protein V502_10998 [Pseudogymnoascus sp. VKM F-4520 (FW-2644)]
MSHHNSFSSQYQGTPPAVFYYTCPWTVTPAAKDRLEASFTDAIDGLGLTARLSYDHDKHFFKIDCLSKEKAMVYSMFSRVIDTFLEEQVGPTVEEESTLATKIGPIPIGVRNEVKHAADEVLLEGFLKTEWSCPRIEQLGGVFDRKLLRQIGELTQCTLTYNSELRKITVVGLDQEACHGAIIKLDKVRDYEVPLFNNPYPNQAHLFYAEEHTEFSTVPTPLKKVHILYETTLLDISAYPPTNLSPYLTLSKAATLRCAIYNESQRRFRAFPLPKEKPEPVIKEAQRGGEFKVFSKHKFAGKGDVDPVLGVVEDVEQVVGGEAESDIAFEKKAKIEVWVRGVEGDGTVPEDAAGEEKRLISPVKEEVGESSRAAEIVGAISKEDAKKRSGGVSPVRAATAINAIPPHLRGLFSAPTPAPGPQHGSLLDMDIEVNLSLTLQPLSLLPTILMAPIAPVTPTMSINPPSSLPQLLIEPLTDTPQLLIELLTDTPQPLIETLQTTPEPTTRTYHHTILRAASNPSTPKGHWSGNNFIRTPPPSLLTPTFTASLHAATTPMLHALRGWRGRATLEVKIGRIWIADAVLKMSESERGAPGVVEGRRMAKWLEGGRRADMSTLVTSEAADVEVLFGMKLFGQDGRFWGKTPKWGVEYIFSCVDPRVVDGGEENGGKFTVRVDAETFRWRCETGERCLGETWVHCLKRVWDFKVSATGRREVDGEYRGWAEELVERIYIP